MRTAYHEQLSELSERLGEMCGLAGIAMERATQALLQADLLLAEQVISDHEKIATLSARAEESAFVLLALQAPVAGDLRAIVSAIQMVADIDRMGPWPCTWPRSPAGAIPNTRYPKRSTATSPKWAGSQSNWGAVRKKWCCPATRRRRPGSAKKTTRWTICTGICSPC